MKQRQTQSLAPWQTRLHEVIYEADTRAGRLFDLVLFWSILISVVTVILESVDTLRNSYGPWFNRLEWLFTLLFTLEYVLRVISIKKPLRYVFSFYGIIDLLAILPTFLSLLLPQTQFLMVVRAFRLMRIFRVLKMQRYLKDAELLIISLRESKHKIILFLDSVIVIVIVMGTLMYMIEGPQHGFTSIPRAIYWAIVTVTTVGYGDIAPHTLPGQALAAIMMILGYSIIAVPTGIITASITKAHAAGITTQACPACSREGHDGDAIYCKYCGEKLN